MIQKTTFASILLMAASTVAFAQTPDDSAPDDTGTPGSTAPPTAGENLPTPQSDNDTAPPVASPGATLPPGGIVSQAGIGGVVGYGRAGVLELGGSAGFAFASEYRNISFAPSIGWFLADNLELSAILNISNIKAGDNSQTLWSALIEPSYHIPLNRSMFAFAGLGVGASHVSGIGTGFALAPRAGMNFMIGRSGVLSPNISYQYTTIDSGMDGGAGTVTVVSLTSAVLFNIGYTAMW
ncbi:MAG: hypothetical protein M3680_05920 [Myxococcota bacterium]|nr:hypothetical protein [Myxococcota bacterium]